MKPIKLKLRKTGENYIFHNTREEARRFADYCNMLADKINELNLEVQELRKKVQE